jgi:DNA-binding MarR family transcriptional regulator
MAHESDEVDRIVGSWVTQRPDLDFSPLEVLSRVDRLSRHLDRARRDAFRRSDLEPWEWDVLSALRRAGEPYQLSPKQLLQQTLVSSGTMTNRIDRLVGRRLVRREADPADGRSVLVTITDEGKTRVDAAITRLVDAEAVLLGVLSRGDRERLAGLLRKLSLGFDSSATRQQGPYVRTIPICADILQSVYVCDVVESWTPSRGSPRRRSSSRCSGTRRDWPS